MKKVAIVGNGYNVTKAVSLQIADLKEELNKLGAIVDILYTDKILVYLNEDNLKSVIGEYDFIVYLDKDLYISNMLEMCGYKLVNSAKSIELCDDKLKTYLSISGKLPIPKTVSSPLIYSSEKDDFYLEIEKTLNYPIVVKEVYGSMGNRVHLVKNTQELKDLREKLRYVPHLYQEFVGTYGQDLRVIVIGGKAVASMIRHNDNDFRSNIELGGKGDPHTLNEKERILAEECAKELGLQYCGVDILSKDGKYYICEVNSNAFWKGISSVTGINIAKLYAEYLFKNF